MADAQKIPNNTKPVRSKTRFKPRPFAFCACGAARRSAPCATGATTGGETAGLYLSLFPGSGRYCPPRRPRRLGKRERVKKTLGRSIISAIERRQCVSDSFNDVCSAERLKKLPSGRIIPSFKGRQCTPEGSNRFRPVRCDPDRRCPDKIVFSRLAGRGRFLRPDRRLDELRRGHLRTVRVRRAGRGRTLSRSRGPGRHRSWRLWPRRGRDRVFQILALSGDLSGPGTGL